MTIPKKTWINVIDFEQENVNYRVTFNCLPEDYKTIMDEVEAYAEVLEELMEV